MTSTEEVVTHISSIKHSNSGKRQQNKIHENKQIYNKFRRRFLLQIDSCLNGFSKLKYLGSSINSKNVKGEDIKLRIAASDRCFYSLGQIFRSRALSKTIKIALYKTMVKPFVVYGSET